MSCSSSHHILKKVEAPESCDHAVQQLWPACPFLIIVEKLEDIGGRKRGAGLKQILDIGNFVYTPNEHIYGHKKGPHEGVPRNFSQALRKLVHIASIKLAGIS